ncbi:MAG: ChaN family lipoprotein [bacterium]|nr:ChaN family lipoprotein [bacterium]
MANPDCRRLDSFSGSGSLGSKGVRTILFTVMVLLLLNTARAEGLPNDFMTHTVDKNVRDFPDRYDLSTPLKSYITFNYLRINGREGLFRGASSHRIKGYLPRSDSPDIDIDPEYGGELLDTNIREVITYRDSVACVISDYVEPYCLIRYLSLEGGSWVNAGEDLGNGVDGSRERFAGKADMFLGYVRRIDVLKTVSGDTRSFSRYLRGHGQRPKRYILDQLADHLVVIYGEVHRRAISWKLCEEVIKDSDFHSTVGTVFLEISAHKQSTLDRFFAGSTLEPELILDVFREIQVNGWFDRGMYEFILELWRLNHDLAPQDKIRVVAVDIPRPFGELRSSAEYADHFERVGDRNAHMAGIIKGTIESSPRDRNNLFIVGLGHAYKSEAPGFGSGDPREEPGQTAGALLSREFPNDAVFSLFTHIPIIGNDGVIHGRLRGGLYDDIFSRSGNRPVAFDLKGSPFGAEPFDALFESNYHADTGSYEDNFDGYIFLGPLVQEPGEYILYELYTDRFVQEMVRRSEISESRVEDWFGIDEVSTEAIIDNLRRENEGMKPWSNID